MYLYCVSDRRENPFAAPGILSLRQAQGTTPSLSRWAQQKIGMIARAEGNAKIINN